MYHMFNSVNGVSIDSEALSHIQPTETKNKQTNKTTLNLCTIYTECQYHQVHVGENVFRHALDFIILVIIVKHLPDHFMYFKRFKCISDLQTVILFFIVNKRIKNRKAAR